ncbi:MAG: nucleotide exchange factor GrpE [bacterium]
MEEKHKKPARHDVVASGEDEKLTELEECRKKAEEYLNGWKRERADFLNYKKEEMERIGHLVKYSNQEIILNILPILDNICLAESHIPPEFANTGDLRENNWIEGFLQIKKQLSDFLQKQGIEAIEVMGKEFDPTTMEAVAEIDCLRPDLKQKEPKPGIVLKEIQRGYTLHGKIIRPAKVKISK